MLRSLRRNLWRITSATLLAALTAATLGIAIPRAVQRISDELYPCMHCSCGCPSAEACWKSCCCYTQSQKVAWAREHGVAPPSFVLAAAQAESEETESLPPCCAKRMAKAAAAKPSCCQKRASKQTAQGTKYVVLIDALRCQGLSSLLLGLPPCVFPPEDATMPTDPLSDEVPAYCSSLVGGDLAPPEPPPPQQLA